MEKPLQAHISPMEDPDEGLTEEEKASIVRLIPRISKNSILSVTYRMLMFIAGSQTALEIGSPSNPMAVAVVPCCLSRQNERWEREDRGLAASFTHD